MFIDKKGGEIIPTKIIKAKAVKEMFKEKQIAKDVIPQIDEMMYKQILDMVEKGNLLKGRITADDITRFVSNEPLPQEDTKEEPEETQAEESKPEDIKPEE